MSKRIVYDVDGTIDLELWSIWDHIHRRKRFLNPHINPERVKYIVTGRHEKHRQFTLDSLADMGIHPKVLLMNPLGITEPKYLMKMKAACLNILLADVYVDDDYTWKVHFHKYWNGIVCDSTEVGKYV